MSSRFSKFDATMKKLNEATYLDHELDGINDDLGDVYKIFDEAADLLKKGLAALDKVRDRVTEHETKIDKDLCLIEQELKSQESDIEEALNQLDNANMLSDALDLATG